MCLQAVGEAVHRPDAIDTMDGSRLCSGGATLWWGSPSERSSEAWITVGSGNSYSYRMLMAILSTTCTWEYMSHMSYKQHNLDMDEDVGGVVVCSLVQVCRGDTCRYVHV